MSEQGRQQQEVSQTNEYEDLRFLLINTKRIFEISREDEQKLKTFLELEEEDAKDSKNK